MIFFINKKLFIGLLFSCTIYYSPTFNPIDKWIDALEENKKLFERLLQSEKDKMDVLETLTCLFNIVINKIYERGEDNLKLINYLELVI